MNVRCPTCETVFRVDPAKVPDDGIRARCTECAGVIPVPGRPGARAEPPPTDTPQPTRRPAFAEREPVRAPPAVPPAVRPAVEPREPAAHGVRATRPISADRVMAPPAPRAPAAPTRPAIVRSAERTPEEQQAPPARPRPTAPVFRPTEGPARQASPVPPTAQRPAAPRSSAAPETSARAPLNPFLSRDPRQKARRLARALVSDMIVYQPEKRQKALEAGNLQEAFAEEIRKSWEEYVEQVGEAMATSTPFFNDALNEILAGGKQLF